MTSTQDGSPKDLPTGERPIVVGVDGSECSGRAIAFAAHEAARWNAPLHVISAYEVPNNTEWLVMPLEPFEECAAANVHDALAQIHELEPSVLTTGDHVHGSAGSVLVAESRDAAMLVVGSRGHGFVTSLALGSVSDHCVHHVHGCPVTVVGLKAS